MIGIRGVEGTRRDSLTAFKQKPPRGGKPARFSKRATTRLWWVGDIVRRINMVFGDIVRVLTKIARRGETIKIYANR